MTLDELNEMFPDNRACRDFFESIIWQKGRYCPKCGCKTTWPIRGKKTRPGLYECVICKNQFTVTTNTPMHSTKLPLRKWLQAMYLIVTSSKGISSVILGRLIGVPQKTAWRLGHAIRMMMAPSNDYSRLLTGIVEADEKFIGGKPRYQEGESHKRGKGTDKQQILIAIERGGPARAEPVSSGKRDDFEPVLERFIDHSAHLMTDKNPVYYKIGDTYSEHSWVNHSAKEYASGQVHNNTAESFGSLLERARIGVFHYMSETHLKRYLHEAGFRWTHRIEIKTVGKKKKRKKRWIPKPVMEMLTIMLSGALGLQLRRAANGGIVDLSPVLS